METVIFFMRHGQVHNPGSILYGRMPRFKLSREGKDSVKRQISYLKKMKIDLIYASPMLRTRQTAGIISQGLGIKFKVSSLLNEVKLIFEGMPLSEYKEKIQPGLYAQRYYMKGQESVKTITMRMTKFLKMIERKHAGKRILIISHGDPIVILRSAVKGENFDWKYKKENYLKTASITSLRIKDGRYYWK